MKNTHLLSVNENYFIHMINAFQYFFKFFFATLAVLIHAFFPELLKNTASNIAKSIINDVENRHKKVK